MDPVRHLICTANGCGSNPSRDAPYVNFVPPDADANTPHVLRFKDVPVDGFWSVTVYKAKGFLRNQLRQLRSIVSVPHVTLKARQLSTSEATERLPTISGPCLAGTTSLAYTGHRPN